MTFPTSIVDVYAKMRAHHDTFGDLYKEGKFWARINATFREELKTSDLSDVRNSFFNRRFAGPDPSNRQVYRALLNLYYKEVEKIDTQGFLTKYEEPVFGGTFDQEFYPFPHGSLLYPFKERRPMSLDFLQSTEEALIIINNFQQEFGRLPHVIVELGSGYGRLGYVIRKMLPECTYVSIDLPEALVCCHHYLSNVLPLGEVVGYEQSKMIEAFDRDTLSQSKVWTLGTQQIERIKDKSVDIFVNIYSFAEMPKEVIANYIHHVDRITDGLAYLKQRKYEDNKFDGVQVRETDYMLFPHWKKIFQRDTTLYPDFFEVLFKNTCVVKG